MPVPAATVERVRSSYIPGLDGIRACACMMVMWAHLLPSRFSVLVPATLGVTIFFFLSGYLICTLLRRELLRTGTIALGDFYIRRSLRILAPLYIVYGLTVLLDRFVLHQFTGTMRGLMSMLFYFYNYGVIRGVGVYVAFGMDTIWSLCVEEHFYILFPLALLFWWRSRKPMRIKLAWLIAFCMLELVWRCVQVYALHVGPYKMYFATDTRLDSILWGSILALANNSVFGDRSILPKRREVWAFAVALIVLAASLVSANANYRFTLRFTVQALCLYVLFSFIVQHIQHPLVRWLEWPPIRYLGWISYVLYLCHKPLFAYAQQVLPHNQWAAAVLCFGLSVAFASLMRYAVELPLQRLRGRFRRVPERDATAADGHGLVS